MNFYFHFFCIFATKLRMMKKKTKEILALISRIKALKYIVVTLFAVVLIGFVDENSAWHHVQNKQLISQLEDEIQQYRDEDKRNNEQIRLLDSDQKAVRKIARERYFMKEDGEDIFVLSDEIEKMVDDETAE